MAHLVNRLVTEDDLKTILGISDAVDDNRLTMAADAATQMILSYCDRDFFVSSTTPSPRVYVADHWSYVEVDDISTTDGLVVKTDDDEDGTFETTWSATDYQVAPLNGRLSGIEWPYTRIDAIDAREFPYNGRQALVQVTAVWGWHTDDTAAAAADYIPHPVFQAAQIQATSIFKSVDAPLGIAGFGDIGIMRLRQALHPVAIALLAPFRKDPTLVR
jgi:hypothetical protein